MSKELEELLGNIKGGRGEKTPPKKEKEVVKERKTEKAKLQEGEMSFIDRRYVYVSDEVYKVLNWMKVNEKTVIQDYVSTILWEELKKERPELIKKVI